MRQLAASAAPVAAALAWPQAPAPAVPAAAVVSSSALAAGAGAALQASAKGEEGSGSWQESAVWQELHRRVSQVVDGEVFRCIELLSLREQAQVAEVIRGLLREQLERARASRIRPVAVVETWDRVVGPLDRELLQLARRGADGGSSSASSAPVYVAAGSVGAADHNNHTKKRRRAEVMQPTDEDEFLRFASAGDDVNAVALLERSCEPGRLLQCSGEGGLTALHHAAFSGHDRLARRLLEMKADADRTTDYGFTPLMGAVQSRNEVLLTTLLEHRAMVNATARFDGRSALHLCAAMGDVELCRALMEAAADVSLKDRKGASPLDKAREAGNAELVQLLELTHPSGVG